MIFIVRHGERADKCDISDEKCKIELPFDPHLTKAGIKQAYNSGKVIHSQVEDSIKANILANDTKYKYMIVSSPFLRCVETAYHVINGLKDNIKDKVKGDQIMEINDKANDKAIDVDKDEDDDIIYDSSIFIDDGFGEILKASYFEKNILPDLYIRKYSNNPYKLTKHISYPIKDIWMKSSKTVMPKYPEKLVDSIARIHKAYDNRTGHIWSDIGYKNVIIVYVTHQIGCEMILNKLKAYDSGMEIDLCSIQQVFYMNPLEDKEDYKVLLKGYSKHLND